MKDNDSEIKSKRGHNRPSYFSPPKEVYIIEDDNEPVWHAPSGKLSNLTKSKADRSSMPSFKLIDEELEEVEPAIERKDIHNIVSEQGIFDHIREKAKNFPVFTPSKSVSSPLSEAPLFKRNRRHDNDHKLDGELVDVEVIECSKIPQQNVLNLTSEIRDTEHNRHINKHPTHTPVKYLSALNFMEEKETIFDHIRKKADNFPLLSRIKQSESPLWTKESTMEYEAEFYSAAKGTLGAKPDEKIKNNSRIISEMEAVSNIRNALSFDISMMKDNTGSMETANITDYKRKKHYSPNESKRQCCSFDAVGKTREVDSFLGFESVFSFL